MKTLEKGQDKIQKICDKIRHETIEPAKKEAENIIAAGKKRAEEIQLEAEKQAEQLIKRARAHIEQERNVFHSSLEQAARQTLESLRQTIEQRLFNKELHTLLEHHLSNPKLIAELINGIVKAIEKDGIATDLSIVIPRSVSANDVNALLIEQVQKKLKNKPFELGDFTGGVQVKLQGKKMTLELTDKVLQELLASFIRKDLRQLAFGA
jgi:V/A-type H+-transporting ATPase subunit E